MITPAERPSGTQLPPPIPPPGAGADVDDHRPDDARCAADHLLDFGIHAVVFAAGMVVIFVVNLATNLAAGIAGHWSAWWSAWALIGWSTAVGVHGLVVRLARSSVSMRRREQ
jgi:hypothetical protein